MRAAATLLTILGLCGALVWAQPPDTLWTGFDGLLYDQYGYGVCPASDGGAAIAGQSVAADLVPKARVVKFASGGVRVWQAELGGLRREAAYDLIEDPSGQLVVTGYAEPPLTGAANLLVWKLSAAGETLWSRTFGGNWTDEGYDLVATADGGYAVAGKRGSYATNDDFYLLKLSSDGSLAWSRTYGGALADMAYGLQQCPDDGYILVGASASASRGGYDCLAIRTTAAGDTLWTRSAGGGGHDFAYDVALTPDGGFVMAGTTASFGDSDGDLYVVWLQSDGSVLRERSYGGPNAESARKVLVRPDGGLAIGGTTAQSGSEFDVLLLRTDWRGDSVWSAHWGTSGAETAGDFAALPGGGYLFGGDTDAFTGGSDFYLGCTSPEPGVLPPARVVVATSETGQLTLCWSGSGSPYYHIYSDLHTAGTFTTLLGSTSDTLFVLPAPLAERQGFFRVVGSTEP